MGQIAREPDSFQEQVRGRAQVAWLSRLLSRAEDAVIRAGAGVYPLNAWRATEGTPFPLGVIWLAAERAYNFAIYSHRAETISVLLYAAEDLTKPVFQIDLDPFTNKSDDVWHCRVSEAEAKGAAYYSLHAGCPYDRTGAGVLFRTDKELLDPYARRVYFPPLYDLDSGKGEGNNAGKAALAMLPPKTVETFDWEGVQAPMRGADLVIYEMHVRGFTRNPNSGVAADRAGSYLGVIDKIPYLKELGITAVELMPVFAFDPKGRNYWGYMPISFFSPHPGYAMDDHAADDEFRQMVKALHQAGIEVILDVVFNHSAEEGVDGPTYGMKAIDNTSYYLTSGNPPDAYRNFSGTGNTLNPASRPMQRLILESLHHWAKEMHVDGFRFDLASVFVRNADGSLNTSDPPLFAEMAADDDLADLRLIAEPWDASDGYLLGRNFPGLNWLQWNGRYRDDVKRFVRGDGGIVSNLMTRMYGSDDLFPGDAHNARRPYQSVNYVVSHDGFTLYDTVAYNEKHNEANGENNTDGPSDNVSWNCGAEGEEGATPEVWKLRRQQVKNFFAILLMSNGTPMFRMGDEFLQTQGGNSNPWNQDNETNWLDWNRKAANEDMFGFVKKMIAFRNAHPSICRSRYWRGDVRWYGVSGGVDYGADSHTLAFALHGGSQRDTNLYCMINLWSEDLTFTIQEDGAWKRAIDTSLDGPEAILEAGAEELLGGMTQVVRARSVFVALI